MIFHTEAGCLMCAGLFQSPTECAAGANCIYAAIVISVCTFLLSPVCVDAQNAARKFSLFGMWIKRVTKGLYLGRCTALMQIQAVDDICAPHSLLITIPQAESTALSYDVTQHAG